jgi:hypothetical protein
VGQPFVASEIEKEDEKIAIGATRINLNRTLTRSRPVNSSVILL